jgi:hypothetical protein
LGRHSIELVVFATTVNRLGRLVYDCYEVKNPTITQFFTEEEIDEAVNRHYVDSQVKGNDLILLPTTLMQENISCLHKNKYHNRISKTLHFWYCPDCKEEVK